MVSVVVDEGDLGVGEGGDVGGELLGDRGAAVRRSVGAGEYRASKRPWRQD